MKSASLRRPAQVESIRRRALDAARELLNGGGVEALQLRAIAGEIGCGVASLYYHFGDKEGLLAALAIEGFGELRLRLERALSDDRFTHRIDAASNAYLRFMERHLPLYGLMYAERSLAGSPEVRAAEQAAFAVFSRSLQDDARVPAGRIEEISLVCWSLGRGIASTLLANGESDPVKARAHAEKVLRGFGYLLSPRFASTPPS